jgi:uncharacterized cupredoxin-like copper-binding protein
VRLILLLIPIALVLSACGGGSKKASTSAAPARQTVQVSEKEFSIAPSAIKLAQTGTYAFNVMNNGTITHAFEIEGNGVDEKTGNLQPGASTTLTVTLSKNGSYEAFCPIDAHRSKGMEAKLTVGAPSATTTTTTTPTSSRPGY